MEDNAEVRSQKAIEENDVCELDQSNAEVKSEQCPKAKYKSFTIDAILSESSERKPPVDPGIHQIDSRDFLLDKTIDNESVTESDLIVSGAGNDAIQCTESGDIEFVETDEGFRQDEAAANNDEYNSWSCNQGKNSS